MATLRPALSEQSPERQRPHRVTKRRSYTRHGLHALRAKVKEEGEGLTGVDYALEGPPEGWNLLFAERGSLFPAVLQPGAVRLAGRRSALPEARDLVEWTVYYLSPKTLAADLKIYTGLDVRDRMGDVRCPVLMILGEDDWLVSRAMVDATVHRLVNARPIDVVTLPGIGHYAPMEAPQAVADTIRKFVAALP